MSRPPETKSHEQFLVRAHYYATRSGLKKYGTGCVIVNYDGSVVSEGWSHYSQLQLANYRSIHAEVHAIMRCDRNMWLKGAIAYIVTIRKQSEKLGLGKPCMHCAAMLHELGVKEAIYTTGNTNQFSDYERLVLK